MVPAQDSQPTAFRNLEKKFQLHREQQIRISKGRKHGGKLVVVPTDFSEVLDLRSPAAHHKKVVTSFHNQAVDKLVYSLANHPGCHIIPGFMNSAQQTQLFRQAVTVFPEPPNRSNLTLQHGHLPSLWAAAQQGFFLQPFHTGSDINLKKGKPVTSVHGNATPAESQSPASPAVTVTATSHSTESSGASTDASHARHQPAHVDEDDSTLSLESTSASPAHPHSGPKAACPLQTATLATDACPEIPAHSSSQQPPAQSSCWSTDPVGPSAASLMKKLRWVALGSQFNWSTRQYENEPGVQPLPSELVTLAQQAVQACAELHLVTDQHKAEPLDEADVTGLQTKHDCAATSSCCSDDRAKYCSVSMASSKNEKCGAADEDHVIYEPNTALVNFYREGDTLGGHKDDAERHKTCPIVSISVGCDAVFLMGGQTKDVVPTAVWLHSGDAVILLGPARQCYHGVPRITPGQLACAAASTTAHGDIIEYMQRTRVNISIRQT
ncbi:hypothetical protein WJX77_008697 [Trebouxia sp. C0004]